MKIVRPNFLINNTIPMTLEKLLNMLCTKGWKPRGKNAYNCCDNAKRIWYEGGEESYRDYIEITPRKLTSKESGLWQFVCENGMVELTEYYGVCNWMFGENKYYDETETEKFYTHRDYQYRLIESALKDESELESFILDNIKV